MFELKADKFAPLMNMDKNSLIEYSTRYGKSKTRVEAASKVEVHRFNRRTQISVRQDYHLTYN